MEMKKAKVAYDEADGCTPNGVRHNEVPELTGYQEISCHLIFNVENGFYKKGKIHSKRLHHRCPCGTMLFECSFER